MQNIRSILKIIKYITTEYLYGYNVNFIFYHTVLSLIAYAVMNAVSV